MKIYAVALAAAALLAACNTMKPAPTTSALFKTSWTAVNVNGVDVPNSLTISAQFGDKQVSGTGGCNRYTGAYEEHGAALAVRGLGASNLSCAPATMSFESNYFSILGAAKSFAQNERGGMTVTAKDGRTIMFMPAGS